MLKTKTILTELQSKISRYEFKKLVNEYKADKNVRNFSSWEMLKVMLFAQFTKKSSLRDIETSLRSRSNYWSHLGLKSISRNNLSNALMKRSAELFEKTFYQLHNKLIKEGYYRKDARFSTKSNIVAIDSSTISLCLNLHKWAKFRKSKGGIKLHTMYNVKDQLPEFVVFTEASKHDVTQIEKMNFKKDGIYIMDRGYYKIGMFAKLNKTGAFFVIRTKKNSDYHVLTRKIVGGPNKIEDLKINFTDKKKKLYSERLRIVRFTDLEDGKQYEYVTNNFDIDASEIAAIYKARWDIELFFKHIKQNMKIDRFYGLSENAVKIQIWCAMICLLLVEFIKFISKTKLTSIEIIRIIRTNIFGSRDLNSLLHPVKYKPLTKLPWRAKCQLEFQW